MNTYYDILEVDKKATSAQIKKAYFTMVRKYPPERFSEKFMEIRKAYEILSDEKTRAEYDNVINIPGMAKERFDTANQLFEQGENAKAIKILEELNKELPDILMIQSLLGEAYIANNNNGKAIKIFENLVKLEPNNASFAGYLAKSYLLRRWHKKAVNGFKRAIELDEDNISLWMGLSEAYIAGENTDKAKEILKELLQRKGEENQDFAISIYFNLFMIDFKNYNLEDMKENLEKLANVAVKHKEARENVAWLLFMIAEQMVGAQVFEPAKEILERAERIAPDKQEIKELKRKVDKFCKLEGEFSSLEVNDNYDEDFVSLIAVKIFPAEVIGSELEIRGAEHNFLENINKYMKYVNLLSEEYPNIYADLKDFFEKAFNNRERNKMIKENEKYFKSHKGLLEMALERMASRNIFDMDEDYDDEEYDDLWYEPQEPFVREEAKIGRNDPCPCGSGKKYKKCCGK